MRNKKIILLIGFILSLLAVQAFSYDNLKTHPDLTEAAAAVYNNQTDQKLTKEQINWLKDGSIAEDTDPRYVNHYYNPTNGEGVSGWDALFGIPIKVSGVSAKVWAKNQDSATGDYSVNAVFKNYREGNLKRAYQGVGHIAHLIQDMAVPAHTRNDSHADGDPYEIWAEQYGAINLGKVNFIQVDSIDKIFDELAGYSNKNFISRDTVFNININGYKIKNEIVDGKQRRYLLNKVSGTEYRILYSKNPDSIIPVYQVDGDFKVFLDYWNMLYPQAIGYSAGAIDYFIKGFKEIDQEKAQEKQLSFWQKVGNGALVLLDDISYIWGDTYFAGSNAIADGWDNLTGAAGQTYDFSQLVYESGKEVVADTAQKSADAIEDIGNKVLSAAATVGESVKHPITADDLLKIKQAAADDKTPQSSCGRDCVGTGGKSPQSSCVKDCGGVWGSCAGAEKDCVKTKENQKNNSAKDSDQARKVNSDEKQETSQSPAGDCDATGTPQSLAGNCGKAKITPLAKGDVARDTAKTPDKAIGNKSNGSNSSVAIDKEIKDIAVKAGAIIPIIEIISKPPAVSSSTKADFQFSVSNEKDFQCRMDSAEWQICTEQISFNDLIQGTHSLKLMAISETGDIASSSYDWLIDIPTVKIALSHIVISEIYFNETKSGSEWIELYNPTEDNVDLSSWTIDTKSDDDADATLPANAVIIKNGYYLIGDATGNSGWNPDNINWPAPDHIETITLNNSNGWLKLKNSASEIIDNVGWKKSGTVDVYEAAPINIADFSKGQSAERKAVASSTAEQMASNGAHELSGNGYDADNNQNDFIIRLIPDPQNSQSPIEPREPVAPEAVGDLIISQPFTGSNSATLYWTAPKNSNVKNSARYDLRYQEKNGDCNLDSTWESATAVASTTLPVPGSEGEAQEAKISGLEKETAYCFALKIFNGEAWSNISNQVEAKTLPDIVACIAIPADEQGIIQTDQLLLAHSPYCSDIYHLTIPQGQVLTIEPGVVVKLKEASNFTVKGELRAIGLPGQPIVFTSYYDNAKGGKVSESDHSPAPGDWGFIAAGPGGKLFMENAVVNYGGYTVYSPAMMQAPETSGGVVYASGGEAKIKNCQIYNNIGGVYILAGASATVSSSDIFSNQFAGIEINTKNAEINITGSNIYDNGAAGILIAYTASSTLNVFNSKIYDNHAGVINDSYTNEPINAVNNWWGDNSGPYHATENPSGQGNKVEGAVLFEPWTGK